MRLTTEDTTMIKTIRPFGSIANQIVKYKFETNEKYYVVDDLYDAYEISKDDFINLDLPIRIVKRREMNGKGH